MRYLVLLTLFACKTTPVVNPSGDCEATSDGAHLGYSVPGAGDVYLPDCNAPLERELWRVFQQRDGTAYIIPRPDSAGITYNLCAGESGDLFQRTGLCTEFGDPDVINTLTPQDALDVTHTLHELLLFRVVSQQDNWMILPFAPPGDLVAACDGPLADVTVTEPTCEWARAQTSGEDAAAILPFFEEDAQLAMAAALNEIYGIE